MPERMCRSALLIYNRKLRSRHRHLASHGMELCRSFLPSVCRANARRETGHLDETVRMHNKKLHCSIDVGMIICIVPILFFEKQEERARSEPPHTLNTRHRQSLDGTTDISNGNNSKFASALLFHLRHVYGRKVEPLTLYV